MRGDAHHPVKWHIDSILVDVVEQIKESLVGRLEPLVKDLVPLADAGRVQVVRRSPHATGALIFPDACFLPTPLTLCYSTHLLLNENKLNLVVNYVSQSCEYSVLRPFLLRGELADSNVVRFAVKIVKCMRQFLGVIESAHL